MTAELAPNGPLCALTWLERCIMAVCAPISGTRAIGKATATASGANVTLRGGSHAVAVEVDRTTNRIDFTRVYKVSPATPDDRGVYRCDLADVTATSAGVTVSMLAVGGGTGHELPVGAKLMWWPPIDGMTPFLTVTEAIDGATNATLPSMLNQIVGFDELGINKADMPTQAWKGKLTKLPAGVLVWWDTAQISPHGKGVDLNTEHFQIYVFNSNLRSSDDRRTDGKTTLDHLQALLTDRGSVDGFDFSKPNIRVRKRGFTTADDATYVHVIDFNASHAVHRIDDRTWNDWLITQSTFLSQVTAEYPDIAEAIGFPDVSFNME